MFPHPRTVPMLILGQLPNFRGHVRLARDQISELVLFGQLIKMCSRDSLSALQWVHFARCSYVGIFDQYSPILCAPCMALYRNCLVLRDISLCLLFSQMLASVSRCPVISCIANLVTSRLFVVFCLGIVGLFSLMPLYARDCEMADSFAPCRLNSLGTVKFNSSGCGLFAPSFASLSACSFP